MGIGNEYPEADEPGYKRLSEITSQQADFLKTDRDYWRKIAKTCTESLVSVSAERDRLSANYREVMSENARFAEINKALTDERNALRAKLDARAREVIADAPKADQLTLGPKYSADDFPVDLYARCGHCGFPRGEHASIGDKCPVSIESMEWRSTRFELNPEPAAESATPRTNAEEYLPPRYGDASPGFNYVDASFARTLETELAAAQSEIERLTKERDEAVAGQDHNWECLQAANDCVERARKERDELRARVATLEGAAAELLRQLSYAFWTSDDGLEQRPGSPEDAPNERLGKAWSALAALSK